MDEMKVPIALLSLVFSASVFVGCATPLKDSLSEVSTGMDKAEVLDKNGSPWLTRRKNSKDTWVYRFYEGEQEYHKHFVFEDGKVITVGAAKPYPDPEEKMRDASNLKEYQKAAKKKQQAYDAGFKDVSGSDDDDD